ncbi:MAG: DUF4870 domain-containing protein [Acidobacteria bacterium]|nr:DUF4870 domain-containing protein [Planctomycetota bacterium]MBE3132510.1 DUF4870 domain-containing protein [Acidobacteriota bacterium]
MSDAQIPPPPPGPEGPGGPMPGAGAAPLPPELQAANASKEDRSMAMIAHLLGLVGFLGPLILYLVKKDSSSKYVQYHMKQSLFYQVALIVVFIALVIIGGIGSFVTAGLMMCLIGPLMGLAMLGAVAYLVYGAVQVNAGKDFEYWMIGEWVRKSA